VTALENGWKVRPLGIEFAAGDRNEYAFHIVEYTKDRR
jgi:hypothetical protein